MRLTILPFTMLLGLMCLAWMQPGVALELRAEKIRWNVYALVSPYWLNPSAENAKNITNQGFVVGTDGVLLFGSGASEAAGAAVLQAIRSVTDKPVRWVVNTNARPAHWLGNAVVAGADTAIIATPAAVERMRPQAGAHGRLPTETVTERSLRQFGDITAELIPLGTAAAPGDLALWLPKQRVLFAGDALSIKRYPATAESDLPHWIAALKAQLEPLEALHVLPGTGPLGTPGNLQNQRIYFEELWERVSKMKKENKPLSEVIENVRGGLGVYHNHYTDFADVIDVSVADIYRQAGAAQ